MIGGTISRANDPDFQPSDLFDLWKEWVIYSNSPSFQLEDNKEESKKQQRNSKGNIVEDQDPFIFKYINTQEDDRCVFRPKELKVLKELFVNALVTNRAASSTALTSEKELTTFLLLVSEASVSEKISTRQALALGLVVRQAYYGNTKSLRIASDTNSMSNLNDNVKQSDTKLRSSSSTRRSDHNKLLKVQKIGT